MSVNSSLSLFQTCPPGLTTSNGTTCDTASCGSIFVAPDQRPAKPSNQVECTSCDQGFTGLNCNVCDGASSCEARRRSSGGSAGAGAALSGSSSELICHNQPEAIRTTYLDCSVEHPTVQSVFPGSIVMSMTKVGTPDDFVVTGIAPWPEQANTVLSTVFLDGVEQFYCQATGCTAKNSTTSVSSSGGGRFGTLDSVCTDLQCHCIPGTTMCGRGAIDLSPIINTMNGSLSMPCDYVDPSATGNASTSECAFKSDLLGTFLGDGGLPLKQCRFGSCITQADLQSHWEGGSVGVGSSADSDKLSGPLIGGLAVLGVAIAALLGLVAFGLIRRRRAAQRPKQAEAAAVGLVWSRIDYNLVPHRRALGARANSGACELDEQQQHSEIPFADGDPNRILRSVSGRVEPGQMMAILGPSGAGKSSLVDILAGKSKSGRVTGEIAFIGGEHGGSPDASTRTVAFVDQDDALPAYSTVREALKMSADLSLPENVSEEEKDMVVTNVINLLGLSLVAGKRIGDHRRRGLSGGERRRVSIGCALVARPRILIADEPLSGLDAFSAARVISAFRNLAKGDRASATTVILTVHQPSSEIFHSFDTVMLISAGRALFNGRPSESMAWCEKQGEACPAGHNVADHLLKLAFGADRESMLLEGKMAEKRADFYADERWTSPGGGVEAGTAWARKAGNVPCTTFMTQFTTLSRRAWTTALRDRNGPLAHILGAIMLGLLVGGCFFQVDITIAGFQNRVGSMYFLYILLCFAALSACTTLTHSRALMVRERSNGMYSPVAWIVSFVLYDAVLLRLIPTVLITTILYFMVGLRPEADAFFEFLLITFLFHESIALYNLTLAALIEDLSVTILFAGTSILFNIGFGGFLLNLKQMSGTLRWLQWLSPLKYALEAVAVHELKGLQLEDRVAGVKVSTSVSVFSGNLFGFDDGAFYRDLLVLALAFNLGFLAILCTAVWWRMRERR